LKKAKNRGLSSIVTLIKDIVRDPFDGIGKPEPLKHHLSGFWSRRIDDEHRLIYAVNDGCLKIAQCRYLSMCRASISAAHCAVCVCNIPTIPNDRSA